MLNDPLIREDEPIPADAKLEFRVVISYDEIEVREFLDEGESEITLYELLKRITESKRVPSGDEQHQAIRTYRGSDFGEVIDTAWYAAVDTPDLGPDRARFEWGFEKEKRQYGSEQVHVHSLSTDSTPDHSMSITHLPSDHRGRYRHPWGQS
jgi:hypothetical protein